MSDPAASRHPTASQPDDDPPDLYGLPTDVDRSLGDLISPDDWRLYHLMRTLPNDDRARVIAFAELLLMLRQARAWAEGEVPSA